MFQLAYFTEYKNTAITNTCKIIALRNMCLLQTISAIETERKQEVDAKKEIYCGVMRKRAERKHPSAVM